VTDSNVWHDSFTHGVAMISRFLKNIGLFCRVSSLLPDSFAKETYIFREPTNRSRPILIRVKRTHTLTHTHTHTHTHTSTHCSELSPHVDMGWLRLVGSLKWCVSLSKEPYKRDDILQKWHVILLLIVTTPYGSCIRVTWLIHTCNITDMGWLRLVGSWKL